LAVRISIIRPARYCSPDAAASTASLPNVRDDRETPLYRAGTSGDMHLIWVSGEGKYFCKRGWTGHFGKHEVILPDRANLLKPFNNLR